MAGEGLRELDHPGARQGPRMVVCDYGTLCKGAPKLVGLLVRLDKGMTNLCNSFIGMN